MSGLSPQHKTLIHALARRAADDYLRGKHNPRKASTPKRSERGRLTRSPSNQ